MNTLKWANCTVDPDFMINAWNIANAELRVEKLSLGDEQGALDFLNHAPLENLILIGFLRENGLENSKNRGSFYGAYHKGALCGVALIGHHTILSGAVSAAKYFAKIAHTAHEFDLRLVMGPQPLVESFCQIFDHHTTQLRRIETHKELLLTATKIGVGEIVPGLRPVQLEELTAVAHLHARTFFELNGIDPVAADAAGFLRRTRARIEKGRVWVIEDEHGYAFKADIVTESDRAVYLEGIWVRSDLRETGFGSAALKALCEELLERYGAICLFANADKHRVLAFYRKAGFRALEKFDSTRYEPICH